VLGYAKYAHPKIDIFFDYGTDLTHTDINIYLIT
jgi:hypothetical protein